MNHTELMERVIIKAENNGWRKTWWVNLEAYKVMREAHFTDLNVRINGKNIMLQGDFVKQIYHTFIFDRKFARAFFGRFWKFHLMLLVLRKNPFGSLENYL